MLRRFTRLPALILLLAFVGGGVGLPVFDAVEYHQVKATEVQRPHIESKDNGACHEERCLLSLASAASRQTVQNIATPEVTVAVTVRTPVRSYLTILSIDGRRFAPSRAPPALPV